MTRFAPKSAGWLFVAALIFLTAGLSFGQDSRPPLLQDIKVAKDNNYSGSPSATPLVQKTGSAMPAPASLNPVRTLFPALADIDIPGYSGVLVESLDGSVVLETNARGIQSGVKRQDRDGLRRA